MASFTLTVPDAELTRVVTALCESAGLAVSASNAKQALVTHVRSTVANVERSKADSAARAAVVVPEAPAVS